MPTTILYPDGDVSNDWWAIQGGEATMWESIDDPCGAEDEGATNLMGGADGGKTMTGILDVADLPGSASNVVSVMHCGNGRQEQAGGTICYSYVRINGSDYMTLTFNDSSYQTKTSGPVTVSPDTAVAWTVAEVNGIQIKCYRPLRVDVWWASITAGHLHVVWAPAPGDFAFLLATWLPPILAVASHGLMNSEIITILKHSKTKPSCREDLARIQEWLRTHPVTLDLHSQLALA